MSLSRNALQVPWARGASSEGDPQSNPEPWVQAAGSTNNCWVVAELGAPDPEPGMERSVAAYSEFGPRGSANVAG